MGVKDSLEVTSLSELIVSLDEVACSIKSTCVQYACTESANTEDASIADTCATRAYTKDACISSICIKDAYTRAASYKNTCIVSFSIIEHSRIHSQLFSNLEVGIAKLEMI